MKKALSLIVAIATALPCAASAETKGWVAWLSTSTVNAKDRLTPGSGPFVRAAGTPATIANDIADLTDGTLQAPILNDERGNAETANVWTGTNEFGVSTGATCSDWTTGGSGVGTLGNGAHASSVWTKRGESGCSGGNSIICFELASGRSRVFIADFAVVNTTGNIGGLAGADELCNARAKAAGLVPPPAPPTVTTSLVCGPVGSFPKSGAGGGALYTAPPAECPAGTTLTGCTCQNQNNFDFMLFEVSAVGGVEKCVCSYMSWRASPGGGDPQACAICAK